MKIQQIILKVAIAICVAYTINKVQFTIIRFIVSLYVYEYSTFYPIKYRDRNAIYLTMLSFNIVYCLVYAFVNTKKNRWSLISLYFLLLVIFYFILLL